MFFWWSSTLSTLLFQIPTKISIHSGPISIIIHKRYCLYPKILWIFKRCTEIGSLVLLPLLKKYFLTLNMVKTWPCPVHQDYTISKVYCCWFLNSKVFLNPEILNSESGVQLCLDWDRIIGLGSIRKSGCALAVSCLIARSKDSAMSAQLTVLPVTPEAKWKPAQQFSAAEPLRARWFLGCLLLPLLMGGHGRGQFLGLWAEMLNIRICPLALIRRRNKAERQVLSHMTVLLPLATLSVTFRTQVHQS